MIEILILAMAALVAAALIVPRIVLAALTKGKVRSKHLLHCEVWDEIGAELKARRLVKEVRRERGEG